MLDRELQSSSYEAFFMRHVWCAASVCFLFLSVAPARATASLIVNIGSTTITGTTGSVNVTISSDQISGDLLQVFNFQFFVAPAPGTTSQLAFLSPQHDSEFSNPAYVFANDSFKIDYNAANPRAPLTMGNLYSTNYTNDTFIGGDFTNSGNDVTVLPSGALLVTLDFTRSTAAPPSNGDTFLVSLGTDPNFNYFQDSNGDSIPFQSNSGTIRIGSAVPEPSSLVLMFIALGGIAAATLRVPGGIQRVMLPSRGDILT
jgi:PEP-CTERM motif-containing protein